MRSGCASRRETERGYTVASGGGTIDGDERESERAGENRPRAKDEDGAATGDSEARETKRERERR